MERSRQSLIVQKRHGRQRAAVRVSLMRVLSSLRVEVLAGGFDRNIGVPASSVLYPPPSYQVCVSRNSELSKSSEERSPLSSLARTLELADVYI